MYANRTPFLLTLALLSFFSTSLATAQTPDNTIYKGDPIYIRIENGFKGLYPMEDEYAEYSFTGSEIKLQDANHILLKPGLGLIVTFADKSQIGPGGDLLADHLEWELNYWRKHALKVESSPRRDLSGARTDLRVTEIKLYGNEGKQTTVYMLALASKRGVFVLSLSPVDSSVDAQVKDIADSFKLVHHSLDGEELQRIKAEIGANP